MKSPLWIINSILALFSIGLLGFITYYWSTSHDTSITPIQTPAARVEPKADMLKSQDLTYIYQDTDLFNTFSEAPSTAKPPIPTLPSIPKPPHLPSSSPARQKTSVTFLEALPIKLTGIISHANETKSQASIVNVNTKQSKSYRVGEKLFDAYVIRILPKKVILIRSNGQQEVLYLHPEDAQSELEILQKTSWDTIVQKTADDTFLINSTAFVKVIHSLAQFIDVLDLTTAFNKEDIIGIRIGLIKKESLGAALGFEPGDIITKINNIPPITTSERIKIYNNIIQHIDKKPITVHFLRNGTTHIYTYHISSINLQHVPTDTPQNSLDSNEASNTIPQSLAIPKKRARSIKKINPRELNSINRKYAQSKAIQRLHQREKYAMNNFGKKSSVIRAPKQLRDKHEHQTV